MSVVANEPAPAAHRPSVPVVRPSNARAHLYRAARSVLIWYMYLAAHIRQFIRALAAFVPSHILSVDYVHPPSHNVMPLYRPWSSLNWQTCYLGDEGVYAIRLWNQPTVTYETYLLNSAHLKAALHIDDAFVLWALHGAGIAYYLYHYLRKNASALENVFDMSIGGDPAFPAIKPVLASLSLPKNVTAGHVALWYSDNKGIRDARAAVVVSDMDLQDTIMKPDAYFVDE